MHDHDRVSERAIHVYVIFSVIIFLLRWHRGELISIMGECLGGVCSMFGEIRVLSI